MRSFCLTKLVAFVIVLNLFGDTLADKRGFILTSPKVLKTGTIQHLTLTLFEIPEGGLINIRLLKERSGDLISETKVFAHSGESVWVELFVPRVQDNKAKIQITSDFNLSDGYEINKETAVHFEHNSLITFIQTDKPIYKPGQTVRFRVFPVDTFLQPIDSTITGDIWIENPSGIRLAQWKNLSYMRGVIQLDMPLSGEPPLGDWTIHSDILRTVEKQKFKVEKYVLPRFEVIIRPPPYILSNASTITLKICARYTYGKAVDGIMRLHVTYKKYAWEEDSRHEHLPYVEIKEPISGCNEVTIQASDLLLQKQQYNRRDLQIYAEVKENGTDTIGNTIVNTGIHRNPFTITFSKSTKENSYFKPGLPFYGKVKIKTPDGNSVSQHLIQICTNIKEKREENRHKTCKQFTSNQHGQVNFVIPPQKVSVSEIHVKAESLYTKQKFYQSSSSLYLTPWYSSSNSYIQIHPPPKKFSCEKEEYVKIQYTMFEESRVQLYYQVISRGIIVQQGSHWRTFQPSEEKIDERYIFDDKTLDWSDNTLIPQTGEFLLTFNSKSFMSPVARLLVFYIKSDGEVIADSQQLQMKHCLPNEVKLKFEHVQQQYPGSETSLHLEAHANSLCGITFVDKSVHLTTQENQLTISKVFNLLRKYDLNEHTKPYQTIGHCFNSGRLGLRKSDFFRRRYFDRHMSSFINAKIAFEEAGMVVLSDLTPETRRCPDDGLVYYSPSLPDLAPVPEKRKNTNVVTTDLQKPKEPVPKSVSFIRRYFPETWLWELHSIGEIGKVTLKHKLPDTITEWVGNAVCINKVGLGISDPVSIVTFQPFFVSIVLPYSVIRGEKAPLIVSVFNYLSECLPIKLSLEPSKQFKIIGGSNTLKMCVCGSKSITHRFMIKPIVLGNVAITVYGNSLHDDIICKNQLTARLTARDAATRKLLVEPEGFPKEETQSMLFCPKDYEEEALVKKFLSLPDNLVKGSEYAYFSVTGNIMGPSLKSLDKLVKLPVGCGEQNMVLFAPNIFVLDYLTSTDRLTNEIKSNTLHNMRTGYQRQLNYRHKDYSYSAFGKSDKEGSMWLTAFVVKSYAQAHRFIFIDAKDLNSSIQWIVSKQLENGCFPSIGMVHNKDMKGGISKNKNSFTALTAYVVIALLETGMETASHLITNALDCMTTEQNPSSYSLALFAYAASLAKHPLAEKFFQYLKYTATYSDNMMYWSNENNPSLSLSIETSGYAILALLQMGGKENLIDALPIIRWIVQQRNSNGGFVSTQDTVVALQALAKYAAFVNQRDLDIALLVNSEDLEHSFTMTSTNQLLLQKIKLPVLPTFLNVDATGDGCALFQIDLHYNVHNIPGSEAFHLNVTSTAIGSSSCNKQNILVCFRYKLQGKTSNMAVIEIKMVSGYIPDEQSLQVLNKEEGLSLKRHDVNGDNVVFYFTEVKNDRKCFTFTVTQELEVQDTLPAVAKLYDYYEQELIVSVNYTILSVCLADVPEINPAYDSSDEFINNITVLKPDEEFGIDQEDRNPDTKFVNVNHELDFPDRTEGNAPVAIKPPHLQGQTRYLSRACPLCLDAFPVNFDELYCNSAFVLRVTVTDVSIRKMKILHDLSSHLSEPQNVNAFANYILHPSCACQPLNDNGYALIVGNLNDLWNSKDDQYRIWLNSSTLVVSTPKNIIQPEIVKMARLKCIPVKM